MGATLRKLGRDDRGQAMAEYGIALAIGAALGWFENVARAVTEQPPAVLLGGAVLVVVLAYVLTRTPKLR